MMKIWPDFSVFIFGQKLWSKIVVLIIIYFYFSLLLLAGIFKKKILYFQPTFSISPSLFFHFPLDHYKTSIEFRYYISSLQTSAKLLANAVRSHWGIENSLHWVLDVAFGEDISRICKDFGAENFAILRHISLNLLKHESSLKKSIKAKRLKSGWDLDYLLKILKL